MVMSRGYGGEGFMRYNDWVRRERETSHSLGGNPWAVAFWPSRSLWMAGNVSSFCFIPNEMIHTTQHPSR
jgi:hypothetical protein